MEELVKSEIARYRLREERRDFGIGRYEGWMLVDSDLAGEIKWNRTHADRLFDKYGYQLISWSSLSYEDDEKHDYGIKKK